MRTLCFWSHRLFQAVKDLQKVIYKEVRDILQKKTTAQVINFGVKSKTNNQIKR